MFYDEWEISHLGSRANVLKHLHGRMMFCPFGFFFHQDNLWSGHRVLIYFIFTNKYFIFLST